MTGYQISANNRTCIGKKFEVVDVKNLLNIIQLFSDYDECLSNNHNCSLAQTCINTNGSYFCVCSSGYVTGADNITCYGGL